MRTIFQEKFDSSVDGLPGGWFVEYNSDLTQVPAIRRGKECIELLSAGNKYLPVIPPLSDFRLKAQFSFSISSGGSFGMTLSFHYDTVTGRGQAFRIRRDKKSAITYFEYGSMRTNLFTPVSGQQFEIADALMNKPFQLAVELDGTRLNVSAFGKTAEFKVKKGIGSIAISREHFFDILELQSLTILSDSAPKGKNAGKFTIPLPQEPTFSPIFCDVQLTDFGNCMEAGLTFHGGVPETEPGEGNYHGMRTDCLTRPFLKIIQKDAIQKNIVFDRTIILVPPGLAPKYFYERLHEQVPWPFMRKVRFFKPHGDFDLAIGFDDYFHSPLRDFRQSPSETVVDLHGKVLYSGLGITEDKWKKEILSQPDKKMIRKLPKTDPRYEKAVEFVKKNHYFIEGENPHFSVRISGSGNLPLTYQCQLQDALQRPMFSLKHTVRISDFQIGVHSFHQAEIQMEELSGLKCGLYHIHFESTDPSVPKITDYAAFEIMSRKKGALPPPLISGLPYMYNSRTETRGLPGDGFDPWTGAGADSGHYISCSNFLPAAARKFDVIPTVHAYQREYFLWLGSRCLDKFLPEDNLDLLAKADYVNLSEYVNQFSLLWRSACGGHRLVLFYNLARKLNDPEFDYESMEKQIAAWKKDPGMPKEYETFQFRHPVDIHNFTVMASKYWEQWLDVANKDFAELVERTHRKFSKINPKLKFSQYGPAHIYAAHLKGPEFTRTLVNDRINPKILGFWQYEDYPFACSYGLETGVYYLASYLMTHPGTRVYPEIYTYGGLQGCPDGAVFFAHPPMGVRTGVYTNRMIRQIYEFVFATGHRTADGFHFWEQRGFQACGFAREWFQAVLKAWRAVLDHVPARPLRTPAFVSSNNSRRLHNVIMGPPFFNSIIDVRNTASEDVPYIYEQSRQHQQCSGFQIEEENLLKLTEKDVSALVLPPLKGMSPKVIRHIRKLHEKGVGLLVCEDVTGLEDLFGVQDTGKARTVTKISAVGPFCNGETDFCDDERCTGRYTATDAEVLLQAEIPVLTVKHNAAASAAFFNIPPQLVKVDRLHQRLGYGKDGISKLISDAAAEVLKMVAEQEITVNCGRLIACEAKKGEHIVIVCNPDDEHGCSPELTVKKVPGRMRLAECDRPYIKMDTQRGQLKYRIQLEPGDGAVLVFR